MDCASGGVISSLVCYGLCVRRSDFFPGVFCAVLEGTCFVFVFSWQVLPGEGGAFLCPGGRGLFLAQHGDHAVEDGYGDDEDADEWLVCVLHTIDF